MSWLEKLSSLLAVGQPLTAYGLPKYIDQKITFDLLSFPLFLLLFSVVLPGCCLFICSMFSMPGTFPCYQKGYQAGCQLPLVCVSPLVECPTCCMRQVSGESQLVDMLCVIAIFKLNFVAVTAKSGGNINVISKCYYRILLPLPFHLHSLAIIYQPNTHEIFTPPFDSIISMIVYMMLLLPLLPPMVFPSSPIELLSLKAFY